MTEESIFPIDGASGILKNLDLVDGASEILKKVVHVVGNEISLDPGVEDELKKLKQTLEVISAKTSDAEKKQVNDVEVSVWLKGLKEAANDAYEILHEFSYEAIHQNHPSTSETSKQVAFRLRKAHKIKNITKQLNQIGTDMERFQFQTIGGPYEKHNQQIKELNYLHVLVIRNLEKMRGIEDAERANLKDRPNVQLLELYWDGEGMHDSSMVSEGLQPHPNLKILLIKGFAGLKLPKWMDGFASTISCLPNLVELKLLNCNSCEQLPSLGLLPCLRVLHMDGMNSVKRLGKEFYYQEIILLPTSVSPSSTSFSVSVFRSLIELRLKDMSSLDEWLPPPPAYSYNSFPSLRCFIISGCFQLRTIPLTSFSSLDSLELSNTSDKVVSSILANKGGGRGSRIPITSLFIQDSPQLKFIPVWVLQHYGDLRSLEISCCSKFQGFCIQNYNEDDKPSDMVFNYTSINSLYSLKLRNCPALTYLPDLQEWKSLAELWIENCDKLKKFLSNYDLTSLPGLRTLYVDRFIYMKDTYVRPPSTASISTSTRRKAGTSNTKPINLVLFGKVGNGRSSLGNSILSKTVKEGGKVVDVKPFVSKASAAAITIKCQMETTTLANGRVVNVIDTPGLFDPRVKPKKLRKQIVKCMKMTKDGIHAFLLVFSIKNRFSDEDNMAIKYLTHLFGEGIINHRIVVYTGADDLEDTTLEEYLGPDCPRQLKKLFKACNGRVVVFDNRTKDEKKREEQLQQLMSHVDEILAMNDGEPFTNELFKEMQKKAPLKPKDPSNLEMQKLHEQAEQRTLIWFLLFLLLLLSATVLGQIFSWPI